MFNCCATIAPLEKALFLPPLDFSVRNAMQVGVCMAMWFLGTLSQAQGYDFIASMIPEEMPVGNVQIKLLLENVEVNKGKERNILEAIFSAYACNPG